ncbi:AraC family transcriptional regulator [Caenimonas sp. S4]|nr:AraC family transcriptional regulator [Caenimonas soli]
MFASQGVDPAWLFEEAGLDMSRLKKRHERFGTADINRLWELAIARSGQPSLGLDSELARRFINFDIPAEAMWPSPSLLAGLESLSRYLLLIGDSASFTLQAERTDCWLLLAHGGNGASPRQRVEFGMLALLLLCQRATRRQLRPLSVEFVFPEPADLHPYRMAFQCPLRFGQPANRMRLGREDLALPIANASESLFAVHERLIEDRVARLGKARTSYRASEEIIRRLHLGEPRRQDVARHLDLSDAALEQRLRAEGSSFEELLDGVRRELAEHYLSQGTHTLGHIAGLLGWTTPSPFNAACKRWFGFAPTQYRQRQAAADQVTP